MPAADRRPVRGGCAVVAGGLGLGGAGWLAYLAIRAFVNSYSDRWADSPDAGGYFALAGLVLTPLAVGALSASFFVLAYGARSFLGRESRVANWLPLGGKVAFVIVAAPIALMLLIGLVFSAVEAVVELAIAVVVALADAVA